MRVGRRRRILVTGAAGLLGSTVCRQLAATGSFDVFGIDMRPPSEPTTAGSFSVADLTNLKQTRSVVGDVDGVVHCASWHAIHLQDYSADNFISNNLQATHSALEIAGTAIVIYTSSTAVYGTAGDRPPSSTEAAWVTEDTPTDWRQEDRYHMTKAAGELMCRGHVQRGGAVTALRCTRLCVDGEPEDVWRLISQGVHVQDAAAAHVRALEARLRGFVPLNVGPLALFERTDTRRLYSDLPALLTERAPEAVELALDAGVAMPERVERVYDTRRCGSVLGHVSQIGPAEALRRLRAGR